MSVAGSRLTDLKRKLVAEMLGMPGEFRSAVEDVRARWRFDDPPTRLPPPCTEGHVPDPPVFDEGTDLDELDEVCLPRWKNSELTIRGWLSSEGARRVELVKI